MERITDITANADGSVNYIFLPEQFETYKTQIYDAGHFQYGFGSFRPFKVQKMWNLMLREYRGKSTSYK